MKLRVPQTHENELLMGVRLAVADISPSNGQDALSYDTWCLHSSMPDQGFLCCRLYGLKSPIFDATSVGKVDDQVGLFGACHKPSTSLAALRSSGQGTLRQKTTQIAFTLAFLSVEASNRILPAVPTAFQLKRMCGLLPCGRNLGVTYPAVPACASSVVAVT